MKIKILSVLLAIILGLGCVLAINPKPEYADFYNISNDFKVSFDALDKNAEKKLPSDKKKLYKKLLKNEKYISKGKLEKAENFYPELIPNLVRLVEFYNSRGEYEKALECAKKIKEEDRWNLVPKDTLAYKFGVIYSRLGDYLNSNNYLIPYTKYNNPIYDASLFQIGQNYFYMQDYKTAASYTEKIPTSSSYYAPAQEVLYTSYTILKKPSEAYKAASRLIKLDSQNPNNYMRLAYTTTNPEEKLINYYKAKNLYFAQNLPSMAKKINELIAPLEQQKIDKAYTKITNYCKKPDWTKIKQRNQNLLQDDVMYWDKRQEDFFETANDCIKRYSGNNLIACFADLNTTQTELDRDLAQENARRLEAKQREEQNLLLIQQNALINEQNRLRYYQYSSPRYYDYYFGRYPYYW